MELLKTINGIFWGWLVAGLLLGTGIFFAFRLSFPQIRYFPKLFGALMHNRKAGDGKGVSGFGALCAALSSQLGTGSLVGVATALASGGPGAIFWMWVTALLGMASVSARPSSPSFSAKATATAPIAAAPPTICRAGSTAARSPSPSPSA